MSERHIQQGCIALVSIDLEDCKDLSTYIVGCDNLDETRALLRRAYGSEPRLEIIVSRLSGEDAKVLKLRPREIRPWS